MQGEEMNVVVVLILLFTWVIIIGIFWIVYIYVDLWMRRRWFRKVMKEFEKQ
jgi:hypothetical protein